MIKAVIYDAQNIDLFRWPETPDGVKARNYLYPLIKEGVSSFVRNVSTQVCLISYEKVLLPFTINEKEYENSYVASNYYAVKFYEENVTKKFPFLKSLRKPFLFLGQNCLKVLKINKTIFLNNWLMTNSLAPEISKVELSAMMETLKSRFPSHTIIFRQVDNCMKKAILEALKNNQFHLLKTREVFLYNPLDKPLSGVEIRQKRRDLRILEKYGFEIIKNEDVCESDYPRILALYNRLYIDKHTKYSPQYTENFIKLTHQNKVIHYTLLKREGTIEGFFGYFTYNHTMINGLFGYDTTLPHCHDIYKILTRLVLEKGEELGYFINDGSGADAAKSNRGMKPAAEYMGLYHRHLPFLRRFLWDSLTFFYKKMTPLKDQI